MNDQEYQKALDYLNSITPADGAYEEDDYLNAVLVVLETDALDRYCRKQPLAHNDYRDKVKEEISNFIDRLNPAANPDPKHAYLTRTVNNKTVNKSDYDFNSNMISQTVEELLDANAIESKAIAYYNDLLKKGSPIPEEKRSRFYDLPIQKIAYETGDVFKSIFKVEKSDEELNQLKETDPQAYEKESKGTVGLNKENLQTALDNYKALTEKAQKTSFIKMLFHLPSYFKLKNNAQKLKDQLINKGVADTVIDGFMKGEIKGPDAFNKNRIAKGEITEEALNQELAQEASLKNNRFAKALDNTEKEKKSTSIEDRLDQVTQQMNKDLAKAQSKRGGDSKLQANIKRWTENYKKAAEKIDKYNKTKGEREQNYLNLLNTIASYQKSIRENSVTFTALDQELGTKYKMDLNDVKTWSNYDQNGINPETGKPFTPAEKELVSKCLEYTNLRQKISSDKSDLNEKQKLKKAADQQRQKKEAEHQKDLKEFKHYEQRLAKVGKANLSNDIDAKRIETFTKLNQKLDVIDEVDEDAYEEEKEELSTENKTEEKDVAEKDDEGLFRAKLNEDTAEKPREIVINSVQSEKGIEAPTVE